MQGSVAVSPLVLRRVMHGEEYVEGRLKCLAMEGAQHALLRETARCMRLQSIRKRFDFYMHINA